MHFGLTLHWWVAVALGLTVAAVAFVEYRRPLAPITAARRGLLLGIRACVLAMLVVLAFRPVVLLPPAGPHEAIVPVIVDVSRSMRISDAGGQPRIARATAMIRRDLLPPLSRQFKTELYSAGDGLAPASLDAMKADATRSDLTGALDAVRARYRGQRVAGIVLISDGGDTTQSGSGGAGNPSASGPPVFAVGVGAPEGVRDREVLGMTAGDQHLDHASVDLQVLTVSHGFGRAPFSLRLLSNGRVLETRRIVPSQDGSPNEELFTVFPDAANATVYTADVPVDSAELVADNNSRSVMIAPAGRKRRVLVVEGAPGFEHSFMKRAWSLDPGLEVDSIVRKGKNAEGRDTFLVQASADRTAGLAAGFPSRKEDLFAYDAMVIANVDGDSFTRAQLTMMGDFVGERGGGLLVTGGRSFAQRGLAGTPLEVALPVDLSDRRGGVLRASFAGRESAGADKIVLTAEGESHPIMRIGASVDETRKLWSSLPPLASAAALGGPRPGADILATAASSSGAVFPLIAVQRYGRGRSMVFGGEASWRWKMMMPSTDRTYELFWRQTARWLAASSPDPVTISVPDSLEPNDSVAIGVAARDAAHALVPNASVDVTLRGPDGSDSTQILGVHRIDSTGGRFTATAHPEQPGLFRVRAEAHQGATSLGAAERWMYVGGSNRELAEPSLNESFLRRVARNSGGRYLRPEEAPRLVSWMQSAARQPEAPEPRDIWDEPWTFAAIVVLLSTEWILRRRWGLR